MKLLKKKSPRDPINLFEVVSESCGYCGRGPLVRYEPEHFKHQCLTCQRVMDKMESYFPRQQATTSEFTWVDAKLRENGFTREDVRHD